MKRYLTKTSGIVAFLAVLTFSAVQAAGQLGVTGCDDGNRISGPRLDESSFRGKVVMIDYWGRGCGPCRAILPRVQQTWEAFNHKPFLIVGSHVQRRDDAAVKAILKEAGVRYPVYQDLRIEGTPEFRAIPFICVFDPRGTLLYSGHSLQDATEAAVRAFQPPAR